MTFDDANRHAETLTFWQREILLLCSDRTALKFNDFAKTGFAFREIKETGRVLESLDLAAVKYVREDTHDDGDGIILNERGVAVRRVVEATQHKDAARETNAPNQ